jgi:hypothetical protein
MATSRKSNGLGGVPWGVVIPVVHAAVDLVTRASCPTCGTQVVLYVCPSCKKIVKPNRRGPAAA